jgi:ABC-type multidrug transport system ATPase subunit
MEFDHKINFLLGKNGTGKTTLIHILAGAVIPDTGTVLIDGVKINFKNGNYKKDIGFLLCLPTYPMHFKLKEYISLLNYVYDIDIEKEKKHQDELLDFFDLNQYLDYKISTLSEGYIKRVKLLSSMLHNPKYYVFDEPFSGLDKEFVVLLMEKIVFLTEQGRFFLIASHLIDVKDFELKNAMTYNMIEGEIIKKRLLFTH